MKQLIETPNAALVTVVLSILASSGLTGALSRTNPQSIVDEMTPRLTIVIDERIDAKLKQERADRDKDKALERVQQQLSEARILGEISASEARIKEQLGQQINVAVMNTRDRVYRREILSLMPRVEDWLRENGVAITTRIPGIPTEPPEP